MEDGGGSFFKPLVFVCSTLCDSELCVSVSGQMISEIWQMFTDFILSSWHQIQIVSCSVRSLCCVESVNIRDWDGHFSRYWTGRDAGTF